MKPAPVARILGILLCFYSMTFLPPTLVSLHYGDGEWPLYMVSLVVTLVIAGALWWPTHNSRAVLGKREGFMVVAVFWLGFGFVGAVPFVLSPHLSLVDAVFETVSGLTTTGATVMRGLDTLPPSLLWYRQQLQWVGGAGVIVLAVAVMPLLRIGGMQLFKAETPGPMKDDKLTPRIAHTARYLWYIYLLLTVACAMAYYLAGMSLFDAAAHSMSTVSTGGFSTHDSSIRYFKSPSIELVAEIFMLLGGINFAVHFYAFRLGRFSRYFRDPEVRSFLIIVVVVTGIVSSSLWVADKYTNWLDALRYGSFQVISVITSTGFGTAPFSTWPLSLPLLLIFLSFIGGCAGSTAGGMKVVRVILLGKLSMREFMRLLHPNIVRLIGLGGRIVDDRVLSAVSGFFALYVATFLIIMLVMMASGVDHVTAFSAVATCMNNLGPGLGQVAADFHDINSVAKVAAVFAMLLGRLEILTMLIVLSPAFWRW